MTPDERYERKARAVQHSIVNDQHATALIRKEAARFDLTLDEFLRPAKARHLIDERESPVLEGLTLYFANKPDDPR